MVVVNSEFQNCPYLQEIRKIIKNNIFKINLNKKNYSLAFSLKNNAIFNDLVII